MPGISNENRPPPVNRITPTRDAYWFAHGGIEDSVNNRGAAKHAESKDAQLQKEREERIRAFQEQKEEERVKRMRELEQSFSLARKHREQLEEERKRKIEEARLRENERRHQVEERKRQIWEAEQERKSAILRRNLEREARIEARRNAQRNSASFAFGSSTPRTFDLDLAALGRSGCPLMSSVSGRRSEERDLGSKRATSVCSLDRKSENLGCEYDNHQKRSSSVEPQPSPYMSIAKQIAIEHMKSERTKACLTMWDDNSTEICNRRNSFNDSSSSRWLMGPGALVGEDCMSWSMTSLSSSSRGRRRTDLTPTMVSRERSITPHTTPRAKDASVSPSRPQSAMSGKSEISVTSSQASGVVMRPRPPAPRKPRPVSIAGTTVDRPAWNTGATSERQSRLHEQNATVPKTTRARSKEPENKPRPTPPPKKPVPPPKSAHVLAKARSHPVPTKDNLRKVVKAPSESNKVDSSDNSESSAAQSAPIPKKEPEPVSQPVDIEKPVQSAESPSGSPEKAVAVQEEKPNQPAADIKPEDEAKPCAKAEEPTAADSNPSADTSMSKPRITSEEEARAALAEKRRLAREQAEREAELERQRQEELRRQEEERKRLEELEQKRQEEEQIRLAELFRKMEEEKLRKAIEEQEQREKEEKARREEEARLKAEKEEQERKAREEANRQRLELEEKLRKEEQERAERKRRVEQIMSRTRIRGSQSADALSGGKQTDSSAANPSLSEARKLSDLMSRSAIVTSTGVSGMETSSVMSSSVADNLFIMTSVAESSSHSSESVDEKTAEQFDRDSMVMNSSVKNGFCGDNIEHEQSYVKASDSSNDLNCVPNRTSDVESKVHTNGYSSHEDSCLTSSPEERSEKSEPCEGVLLDAQSATHSVANNLKKDSQMDTSNQLIDIGMAEPTDVSHNNNYMVNVDIVNSNINSDDPFHTVSDNLLKKQENTITDLLS